MEARGRERKSTTSGSQDWEVLLRLCGLFFRKEMKKKSGGAIRSAETADTRRGRCTRCGHAQKEASIIVWILYIVAE